MLLLRSRAWVVILIIALGGAIGSILTLLETPIYQAKTTLEIQPPVEGLFGMQAGAGRGAYQPESFLQTQVKTLESRSLRARVFTALRAKDELNVETPPEGFPTLRKIFRIPTPKTVAQARPSVPLYELKVHAFDNTQLVEILCDSPDPAFSTNFLNTMTDQFIQLNLDSRWRGDKNTADWLTRQLSDMKGDLERSEIALQSYSAASGLLFTDEKDSMQSGKLKQLQEEATKAEADRVLKQAALEVSTASSADAVPQVIDNDRLSGYQTKITELRRELAELSSLYTPDHYRVIRVKAQIAEVEGAFIRDRDAILARIKNDYQAAQRREKLLVSDYNSQTKVVSEQAAKAIHYDVLKRDVDTNRQLYDALLQKVKESSVASALAVSNIRVLDPAERPSDPYKPSLVSNLLKGLSAGLVIGLMLIVGTDRINRSLRAPGEAPHHLKVPELGVIPSGEPRALNRMSGPPRTKHSSILLAEGEAASEERVELVTWHDSSSLVAESFRNTLASILLTSPGSRPRVIMVTSAFRDEGKSTTVSNLGLGLAEINQKILLIDADMRKPRLHHLFDLTNSWGLTDLLREKSLLAVSPLGALARPTQVANLWVLPSGPGTLSISNLLYSERMSQLLQRLREEFDTILIDTPPMLMMSDARILGRLADGAILVIRAGQTTRDAALIAKQRLVDDGIPVIGTILNRWDQKAKTRYGNQGYYYSAPS